MTSPNLPPPAPMPDLHRMIGTSVLGRPLLVRHLGPEDAPLRVLLLCGQHGDERGIRRALAEFLEAEQCNLCGNPSLQVAVLAEANPDGAEQRTRTNAEHVDLNRDHLLLQAPETRAIHRFVADWEPHLVVDLHNYPSRRAHLVRKNLRLAWDVCLDHPTNPATSLGSGHPLLDSLMQALDGRLADHGHLFGRYSIVDGAVGVRHGTPALVDARNVLSLRYGCLTLLLEARNPGELETRDERQRVRHAVAEALRGILDWAVSCEEQLIRLRPDGNINPRVPLRYRRRAASAPAEIPVVDLSSAQAGTLLFPRYRPYVEGRRSISPPPAYAVPLEQSALLGLLSRQGFHGHLANDSARYTVEQLVLSAPYRVAETVTADVSLAGSVIFPFRQRGGRLLALLLEPESRYARHTLLDWDASSNPAYPVRRVLETEGALRHKIFPEVIR
jgi:hypothetical protein